MGYMMWNINDMKSEDKWEKGLELTPSSYWYRFLYIFVFNDVSVNLHNSTVSVPKENNGGLQFDWTKFPREPIGGNGRLRCAARLQRAQARCFNDHLLINTSVFQILLLVFAYCCLGILQGGPDAACCLRKYKIEKGDFIMKIWNRNLHTSGYWTHDYPISTLNSKKSQ